MGLYSVVVLLHSYVRWIIVVLALLLIARCAGAKTWTKGHESLHRGLVGAADLQFLLGAILYSVLSPIPRAFLAAGGAGMKEPTLRFFGVEHVFGMVVAVTLLHVSRVRAKKAPNDEVKARRVLVFTSIASVILLISIPWPFVKAARPLFRGVASEAAPATCPPVFQSRCAACHGAEGRGDGAAAQALKPPPRDFAEAAWQLSKTDAHLHDVIQKGGAANGLSVAMPANTNLSSGQVDALVQCVRSFKR